MTENWAAAPYLSDAAARQLYAELCGIRTPCDRTFRRWRNAGVPLSNGKTAFLHSVPKAATSKELRYRRDDVVRFAVQVNAAPPEVLQDQGALSR